MKTAPVNHVKLMDDPHQRQQDNLDWYQRLLLGEEAITVDPFVWNGGWDGLDPVIADRITPHWRNPLQLLAHVKLRQANNGHAPFTREALWREGDVICMRDKIGHVWRDTFTFDEKGNFSGLTVRSDLADGYTLRHMGPDDLQAVEDMNQVARIQVDNGTCTINRNGTTRDYLKLLKNNLVCVVDAPTGEMVSVGAAAALPLRISGIDYFLQYTNHFRTHEDHRKYRMMRCIFNEICVPRYDTVEGTFFVMHGGNQHIISTAPALWRTPVLRAVFDCAAIAGPNAGRKIEPDDAGDVATILNGTHGRQELYLPLTPASLEERLSRCPEAYSWRNLKRLGGAVLGSWFSGEDRHYEVGNRSWTERRGLILDYGAIEGSEAGFEALIRSAAREALERGLTHLTLFVSERARLFPVIQVLADHFETYRVNCSIPEPETTSETGIYVDPILA